MYFLILLLHTPVSPFFAKSFTKEPVSLERPLLVATSMRETLLVEVGYRSCSVLVGEIDIVADLMILDMTEFDVILGIDWLASCHATLDCHAKAVKFSIPGESAFIFQRDHSEIPCNIISMMSAR